MRVFILIGIVSYLLGSIPFGYLLVRIFRGEDVRQSGSGNIGATNVSRKSPVLGVLTLLLDAAKGSAAVALAYVLADHLVAGAPALELMGIGALFSVVGHVFPVWLRFRGGKGVATGLGAFLLIAPKAALIAVGIFVIVAAVSRYVSLGSMVAVAVFPIIAGCLRQFYLSRTGLVLISLACLLILVKHRENLRRLMAGTENHIGAKRA